MLTNKFIPVIFFFLSITLLSCHMNVTYFNTEEDKNDAEKVTTEFYDKIKMQDFEGTYPLFSDKFFANTSQNKLSEIYLSLKQKLGTLQETKLDKWQTRQIIGTDRSRTYTLIYKNKYEKFDAIETIYLILEDNDQVKIVGYNIQSEALLK